MTKRLQVLLDVRELRAVQNAARHEGVTVAEWVRAALRAARSSRSLGDSGRKLDAIRAAAQHAFPTADMPQMTAEIERGYSGERR